MEFSRWPCVNRGPDYRYNTCKNGLKKTKTNKNPTRVHHLHSECQQPFAWTEFSTCNMTKEESRTVDNSQEWRCIETKLFLSPPLPPKSTDPQLAQVSLGLHFLLVTRERWVRLTGFGKGLRSTSLWRLRLRAVVLTCFVLITDRQISWF